MDDFLRSGGARTEYAIETRSSLMACQLARDGAGVAILDRLCIQAIDLSGLVLRPLAPERWILFGYIHQLRQQPGGNAMTFLDCVQRTVEAFRARSAENARAVVPLWKSSGVQPAPAGQAAAP